MKQFLKETFKTKHSKILLALLCTSIILTILSMIFPMLFVKESITSMNIQYVTRIDYEWRIEYQYQCSYQYQWFLGQYQYQYVCNYVPIGHYVPVWKTVPQYFYITTFFDTNVHLFDMILSTFSLGTKQLYFVIPILLILFSGACLAFFKKPIFKKISYICLGFIAILFTGSTLGVLRLFITNTKSSTLGVSFYLMLVNTIIFITISILSYKNETKENYEGNQSLIIENNRNYSLLIRFIIFIILVVMSEISVTTIYGFILYPLFLSGLVLSYNEKLWSKILMLVGSSGIFIYSMVTMILVLIDLTDISHFFDVLPIDRLLMHIANLGILIVTIILYIKETKKLKNAE